MKKDTNQEPNKRPNHRFDPGKLTVTDNLLEGEEVAVADLFIQDVKDEFFQVLNNAAKKEDAK